MTLKFQMCFIKCPKVTLRNIGEGIGQTLCLCLSVRMFAHPFWMLTCTSIRKEACLTVVIISSLAHWKLNLNYYLLSSIYTYLINKTVTIYKIYFYNFYQQVDLTLRLLEASFLSVENKDNNSSLVQWLWKINVIKRNLSFLHYFQDFLINDRF